MLYSSVGNLTLLKKVIDSYARDGGLGTARLSCSVCLVLCGLRERGGGGELTRNSRTVGQRGVESMHFCGKASSQVFQEYQNRHHRC